MRRRLRLLIAGNGPEPALIPWPGRPGASQALHLDEALEGSAELPNGALVPLPTRNVVCAVPIRTARSVNAISNLIQLSQELAADDSAPLGPTVYWHRDREIESLNARLQDGHDARLRVSARLKERMDLLPARPPPPGPDGTAEPWACSRAGRFVSGR
ncbi:hypothetical protein ACFCYX_33350 [Streptomyces populi]|uniref:hypothetical protein n=1 Tax=Streptomyces populi TaxID=2058924 RepID=UPI0035D8481B